MILSVSNNKVLQSLGNFLDIKDKNKLNQMIYLVSDL